MTGSDSPRKQELLEAAYRYVLGNGLASMSLRPLAKEIGSSPRVLLFLFGSKEGLIRALLARAREDELRYLHEARDSQGMRDSHGWREYGREVWSWLAAPSHGALLTLWVEGYARSLLGDPGPWAGFGRDTVNDWLQLLARHQPAGQRETPEAEAERTLLLAVLRGALLDLLATGDIERVTAAVERHLSGDRHHGPGGCLRAGRALLSDRGPAGVDLAADTDLIVEHADSAGSTRALCPVPGSGPGLPSMRGACTGPRTGISGRRLSLCADCVTPGLSGTCSRTPAGQLVVVVTDHLYRDVLSHAPGRTFARADVTTKELAARPGPTFRARPCLRKGIRGGPRQERLPIGRRISAPVPVLWSAEFTVHDAKRRKCYLPGTCRSLLTAVSNR